MPLKGFEKFREKVPALSGSKIIVLPIFILLMVTIAIIVYFTFDTLPMNLASSGLNDVLLAFFPVFGVLLIGGVGFILVFQMWVWRDHLKAMYGPTSYQRVFPVGLGGVIWILTAAFNQYIPYYSLAPTFWATSPLQIIATPLENFFGVAGLAIYYIRDAFAVFLLIIGFLLFIRAVLVFGLDYMFVVYLYFPEESQIQQNEIYSALRHPAYAGALAIGLGGTLFVFTLLSFLTYAFFLAGFYFHIHFVEEKELIQRFGDSYREYRRRVPAFFVSPRKLSTLFGFLFKGH